MRSLVSCLLVVFLVAASGAPLPAQTFAGVSAPDCSRQVERETFKLINAYRDGEGLAPLRWNEEIAAIARGHSRDMASGDVDFGHDGFGDRVDQMKQAVAGFQGAGENVLYTSELDAVARRAVQIALDDLLRGRIDKFSLDALVDIATRAGLSVRVRTVRRAA